MLKEESGQEPEVGGPEAKTPKIWEGEFDENGIPSDDTYVDFAKSFLPTPAKYQLTESGTQQMVTYLNRSKVGRNGMVAYFVEKQSDEGETLTRLETQDWWNQFWVEQEREDKDE